MFVIGSNGEWHVQVRKYWQGVIWLRDHGSTLDVLVRSKTDVNGRLAWGSELLCSGVFVQHSFTECRQLLPFKATVLAWKVDCYNNPRVQRSLNTHDKLFVPHGHREVSVEGDPKVIGVVTLDRHNVFQKRSLMTEDLSQTSTSNELV